MPPADKDTNDHNGRSPAALFLRFQTARVRHFKVERNSFIHFAPTTSTSPKLFPFSFVKTTELAVDD